MYVCKQQQNLYDPKLVRGYSSTMHSISLLSGYLTRITTATNFTRQEQLHSIVDKENIITHPKASKIILINMLRAKAKYSAHVPSSYQVRHVKHLQPPSTIYHVYQLP